jgi:hypothetical protein
MKANRTIVYKLTVLAIGISFICSSCKKSSNICGPMLATGINPFAAIEIRNTQNKDLLDPATPGHYDTAMIKRSNSWFKISPPGFLPVKIGFDYFEAQGTHTLNLSDADQGTLNISVETIIGNCNRYSKLSDIQYNNVTLTPDSAQTLLFIIHK